MSMIHMICSDVDGTVLNDQHQATQRTCSAVQSALQAGIPFVLTSGRIEGSLRAVQQQIGITGPLVCLNGTHVVDTDGSLIFERTVDPKLVRKILPVADTLGLNTFLFKGNNWFSRTTDDWTEYETRVSYVGGIQQDFDQLLDQWEAGQTGPNKILCMSRDTNLVSSAITKLQEAAGPDIIVSQSSPRYIEIYGADVDKGVGIRHLAKHMGMDVSNVMAIGDYFNDIPMFNTAGTAVLMANAPQQLHHMATWMTASNNEDGVAQAIERVLQERR